MTYNYHTKESESNLMNEIIRRKWLEFNGKIQMKNNCILIHKRLIYWSNEFFPAIALEEVGRSYHAKRWRMRREKEKWDLVKERVQTNEEHRS